MDWLKLEGPAYWAFFVAMFLAVAIWESRLPNRTPLVPTERRWGVNGALMLMGAVLNSVVLRTGSVALALTMAESPWGMLNRPWIPYAAQCTAALLALDLVSYLTHRIFHAVPALWRIHEAHHSDPDYDVSTAGRFHPLETLVVKGSALAAIAILAPPVAAVFAAEMQTAVTSLLVHANARLSPKLERRSRKFFITPDLHRIHHSEDLQDQNRNFGQTLVCWDRLFGTYLDQPASGEAGLVTGVKELRSVESAGVWFVLAAPFRRRPE